MLPPRAFPLLYPGPGTSLGWTREVTDVTEDSRLLRMGEGWGPADCATGVRPWRQTVRRSGSLGQAIGSPPPSPRSGIRSAGFAPRRGNWANPAYPCLPLPRFSSANWGGRELALCGSLHQACTSPGRAPGPLVGSWQARMTKPPAIRPGREPSSQAARTAPQRPYDWAAGGRSGVARLRIRGPRSLPEL